MDVVFTRSGDALYIADFGSMVVRGKPMPIRNTGVIWRVTREGQPPENQPPANLSAPGTQQQVPQP